MEEKNGRFLPLFYLEGFILITTAPFLLFPTFSPGSTAVALVSLASLWVFCSVFTHFPFPLTPFNLALLLFALALLLSIGITADPILTSSKTTNLLLGVATWRFLSQLPHRRALFVGFFAFALVSILFTLAGLFSVNWLPKYPLFATLFNGLPANNLPLPESPAAGVHANQLAGTILFYWPWWLSLCWGWQMPRFTRFFSLLWAAFMTLLLVLTQSRSGWLGGMVGLLVLWLGWRRLTPATPLQRPILSRRAALLALLLLLGVMIWQITQPGWQNLNRSLNDTSHALGFRLEVWRWGLTAVHNFPFTGIGLGSFRHAVRRLYPLDLPVSYDISHAHNIFLQTALDIGLPGLITYLAILGVAVAVGWRVAKQDDELRPFVLGLLASLAAFHTYGLTDALALGAKPAVLLWFILGLLAALARHKPPQRET